MDSIEAMDELYARVPDAGCKGLCQEACGPLPMTVLEGRRLRRAGRPIPHDDIANAQYELTGDYSCPALVDGRCSVYEIRPLICRLYGAVENMRCRHGCAPAGGHFTVAEASQLVAEAHRIGGGTR